MGKQQGTGQLYAAQQCSSPEEMFTLLTRLSKPKNNFHNCKKQKRLNSWIEQHKDGKWWVYESLDSKLWCSGKYESPVSEGDEEQHEEKTQKGKGQGTLLWNVGSEDEYESSTQGEEEEKNEPPSEPGSENSEEPCRKKQRYS